MSAFSFAKYLLISVIGNLAFAFLILWFVGRVTTSFFVHARVRLIDPLFYLGGYMYTWKMLATSFPYVGYVMLLNPVMHVMEGARAAVFGGTEYINFWLLAGALVVQTVFWAAASCHSLRKKLDYVPG